MGVVRLLGKQQPDKQYRLTPITETAAQVTEVKGQKGKIAKQFVLGHISDDPLGQIEELTAAAKAGADGIVLVINRLDPKATGTETFRSRLKELLDLCHSHNVLVSPGGFIEHVLTQRSDAVTR